MAIRIKRCPFCGADQRYIFVQNEDFAIINHKRGVYLACIRCKAYGPDRATKKDAITSWNMRGGKE